MTTAAPKRANWTVISLTAAAVEATRRSKLPPVALLMVALTVPASTYTSSPGAATLTLPVVAPLAMLITLPLESVTLTALCAALVRLAV